MLSKLKVENRLSSIAATWTKNCLLKAILTHDLITSCDCIYDL